MPAPYVAALVLAACLGLMAVICYVLAIKDWHLFRAEDER